MIMWGWQTKFTLGSFTYQKFLYKLISGLTGTSINVYYHILYKIEPYLNWVEKEQSYLFNICVI